MIPPSYQSSDLPKQTWRFIRRMAADTFQVPVHKFPRILFHGVILAMIISGFWLLDSLKDPVLAITVGLEHQPTAKFFSVCTTLLIVCLYDYLTSMVSKPYLFHIISAIFGLIMMILSALLSQDPALLHGPHKYLGYITYFSVEAYGSLMVALFWSFTNSIMDLEQAKGAYGLIIGIAQIGAILGSTIATNAEEVGIPVLFMTGSMMIFSISLIVKAYHIVYRDAVTEANKSRVRSISEEDALIPTTAAPKIVQANLVVQERTTQEFFKIIVTSIINFFGGFYEGLSLIIRHTYVLKLLGVSCLYEIVLTVLDYEFKLLGSNLSTYGNANYHPNKNQNIDTATRADASDKFANLLGHFGQVTNMLSLFISIFGFSYIVHRLGVKRSLMIFPTLLMIAVIVSYLVPNLWVLFMLVSVLKGMIFSLHDPTHELLYIQTSDSIKFKAKAWIDVFGSRFAKAAGSSITSFAAGDVSKLRQIAEIPCIILSIIIIYLTWSIGGDFEDLVDSDRVVGEAFPRWKYDIDLDGPIINGRKPGDVGYQGYNLELFRGVFDEEDSRSTHGERTTIQDEKGDEASFYSYGEFQSNPIKISEDNPMKTRNSADILENCSVEPIASKEIKEDNRDKLM